MIWLAHDTSSDSGVSVCTRFWLSWFRAPLILRQRIYHNKKVTFYLILQILFGKIARANAIEYIILSIPRRGLVIDHAYNTEVLLRIATLSLNLQGFTMNV